MKKCPKCKEEKCISLFGKDTSTISGYKVYCKKCRNKNAKLRARTVDGLITRIYGHQKDKSRKRGHKQPDYSLIELREYLKSTIIFHKLFKEWSRSNFKKDLVPSCDRLDNSKGYSFNNIEVVTWEENNKRGRIKKACV
jgi:hypothetical protein